METTKTSNETFLEGVKVAEKWFNDTSSAMMEVYNKQLSLTTGLYNNFYNSLTANKKWGGNQDFMDLFFKNDVTKWFPFSFNGSGNSFFDAFSSNPLVPTMTQINKQISDYNRNLLASLNNDLKYTSMDWGLISKEYTETVENRLEAYKNILESVSNAYKDQLDLSIETNKKLFEEMNNQFNSVFKQNQKFYTDTLKYLQASLNREESKTKEQTPNVLKKPTGPAIVA